MIISGSLALHRAPQRQAEGGAGALSCGVTTLISCVSALIVTAISLLISWPNSTGPRTRRREASQRDQRPARRPERGLSVSSAPPRRSGVLISGNQVLYWAPPRQAEGGAGARISVDTPLITGVSALITGDAALRRPLSPHPWLTSTARAPPAVGHSQRDQHRRPADGARA